MFRAVLFLAPLTLGSCSNRVVDTDRNPAADFSQYRSWSLGSSTMGESLPPTWENGLLISLHEGLAAKGLEERQGDGADLTVSWHMFSRTPASESPNGGPGYGRSSAWLQPRASDYSSARPPSTIESGPVADGVLVLDFVDNHTRQIIFRGVSRDSIDRSDPTSRQLQKAVADITADYPGPPGSADGR